jgi:hypothetical protein
MHVAGVDGRHCSSTAFTTPPHLTGRCGARCGVLVGGMRYSPMTGSNTPNMASSLPLPRPLSTMWPCGLCEALCSVTLILYRRIKFANGRVCKLMGSLANFM